MLVLSRKVGEKIVVGDNVVITVSRVAGNRVTIGIEAPNDVRIVRGELEPILNAFQDREAQNRDEGMRRPAPALEIEVEHGVLNHV